MQILAVAAVGLLLTVAEAAPLELKDATGGRAWGQKAAAMNRGGGDYGAPPTGPRPQDCPRGSVVVSTTVDVTVYVTPTGKPWAPPPGHDETASGSPPGDLTVSLTFITPTARPVSGSASGTPAATLPAEAYGGDPATPSRPTPTLTAFITTPQPPGDRVPGLGTVTPPGLPQPPATTSVCLIDAAMTPVARGSGLPTPLPALPNVTRTVYRDSVPTGTPAPGIAYCGVPGEAAGTYFLAEFIEERSGVPVSPEGCYQFCHSLRDTRGCQSYRYFANSLGAPRCRLYGMPVSRSVRDLDARQPGAWYDLACGPPGSGRRKDGNPLRVPRGPRVAHGLLPSDNTDYGSGGGSGRANWNGNNRGYGGGGGGSGNANWNGNNRGYGGSSGSGNNGNDNGYKGDDGGNSGNSNTASTPPRRNGLLGLGLHLPLGINLR